MNYQSFKNSIIEYIRYQLGSTYHIFIQSIIKNNGIRLDGLIIMPEETNIAPTIYLNYYFQKLKQGIPFENICTEIINYYQKHHPESSVDIQFFTDLEQIQSHIAYKLINFEKNLSLLDDIPYIRFLDLAIVFYCLLPSSSEQNASILIHNQHLSMWNLSLTDLYSIAKTNTPDLLGYELLDLHSILRNSDVSEIPHQEFCLTATPCASDEQYPMYVLSSQNRQYGAACILYQNLLKHFSQKTDMDFYILPSSIHEVILVPTANRYSLFELSEMVSSINHSEVNPEDVLSDHAYYYSREEDRISM
ncbi:Uncharacterised protein [uncultured Roseburia sp.]|uniref:DUF5688 family protein n=1 Tax=Brotonthovivens ammoniilytica TaxID=2981725 RepID=A0ABT2TFP3_9FIRM|nr:DUF5688 family protein [Brotonthovivens ammoniilytica]MCU6761018.1 DUF5688 family protein [Brotonthovivens ammoniilytica]SCI16433.1 Uncharacterised protein [uncultured Roseburia sp.]